MALSTRLKLLANGVLRGLNLQLQSLTAERVELHRLGELDRRGHFSRPVFPLPQAIKVADHTAILAAVGQYTARFDDFADPARNAVGYSFANPFYSSPDAELLYTFVRERRPQTILEIGSGNSTMIARQAIIDAGTTTALIAIDPSPRAEIAQLVDRHYCQRVEAMPLAELAAMLTPGDFLFIDSSHELRAGNDVVYLLLQLLPLLAPGVIIHLHDIFLPYDYPRDWVLVERNGWTEQYLVQALLWYSDSFEVLWAGHYLQRTRPNFDAYFPHLGGRRAQSLWLRKRREGA